MSDAARAPRGGRQGSLKQSEGHQVEIIRDRWAELMLAETEYDDMSAEVTDIVDALQMCDPEMTVTDTQIQESYQRFCEKNPQLLESEEIAAPAAAKDRELPAKSSRKPFKRILVLAAALLLVLSLLTVQASGFNLFRALAEWTASVLQFGNDPSAQISVGENDLTLGEIRTYETPEEMLADLHIEGDVLPTWIPERFSLQRCEAKKVNTGIGFYVIYNTENNESITLKWWYSPRGTTPLIEKSEQDVLRLRVNDVEHYIFYDNESETEKAVWRNGDFECRITGTISRGELERIVKSIYGR